MVHFEHFRPWLLEGLNYCDGAKGGPPGQLMIDSTHLKAHRTAASLLKGGMFPVASGAPKAA